MKNVTAILLALAAAGCGGAPEPLPIADLEGTDLRFAPPAPADPRPVSEDILKKDEFTLADVLAIADLLNPTLASERKSVDLATAAIWEARLYPNPSLLAEIEDYRTDDKASLGKSERVVGLGLPLVFSGRISAATSVAEKEREIAAVQYVWRRREILSDVKRAFFQLLTARRNAELARETRDLAKTFHTVTDERYKAQAIPEMELLKAAVNLARAEIDLKTAEKAQAVSLKTLHALMGNVDFPKERFAGDLQTRFVTPSLEALRGHVTASHPLLERAARAKEAAELQLTLARRERIPDVELQILGGRDPDDDTILEAGLAIPLPLFNRNQAKIAAAEIRIRKAELDLQAVRNDLLLRLHEAYRTFAVAQERVAVYQDDILPKAEKALSLTSEGYRQGKLSYLDVLDSQRTLADARIAFVSALSDLSLAATELEKITGTRLEPMR